MSVADAWNRIEKTLSDKFPLIYATLKPGAADEDITHVMNELPVDVPGPLVESLRIHNGQKDPYEEHGIFDLFVLMSSHQIAELYHVIRISRPRWKKGWIPIARRGDDCIVIDALPNKDKPAGRILLVKVDKVTVMADSLAEWLGRHADKMEKGKHQLYWWTRTWNGRWGKLNALAALGGCLIAVAWGFFNYHFFLAFLFDFRIPTWVECYTPLGLSFVSFAFLWRYCGGRTGPMAFFLAGSSITLMTFLAIIFISKFFIPVIFP